MPRNAVVRFWDWVDALVARLEEGPRDPRALTLDAGELGRLIESTADFGRVLRRVSP